MSKIILLTILKVLLKRSCYMDVQPEHLCRIIQFLPKSHLSIGNDDFNNFTFREYIKTVQINANVINIKHSGKRASCRFFLGSKGR